MNSSVPISPDEATKQLAEIEETVPPEVRKLLEGLSVGSRLQFYLTGKGSLGGETPLASLEKGRLKSVLTTAEGFAQR